MLTFMNILVLSSVGATSAGNILILLPLPLYSHTNTFLPVFKELAARGHNITMVSPFPQKERFGNWTDLVLKKEPFVKYIGTIVDALTNANIYLFYPSFWRFCTGILEMALQDEVMQELIKNDNLKFDLLVTEVYYAHEALAAFAHKLDVPLLGVHPYQMSPYTSYLTGNQIFRADTPNYRSTFTNQMTFTQRLLNTIVDLLELSTAYFYYLPMQEKLAEKYMTYPGSENRPPLIELLKNITILLTDSHSSIGYPRPLQPNIIEVGGLSIRTSMEIPEDLQSYMDNSPNGYIYLNFGTFLSVSSVGEKAINSILSTFRKLEVNVLMKWEKGELDNKPPNVLMRDWFPQTGVLAHANCRLFITHGGLHSLSEAAYHGVPVVGIPFFGDQEFNLRFAEEAGYGVLITSVSDVTEDQFHLAVTTVLHNKSYKENAMRLSKITRDRPMSPLDTAIYWIEYVLRHKNVQHLKPSAQRLPLYQQFLVDVFIAIFAMISIVFISIFIIIIKLIRLLKKKDKSKVE